ncbi:MAG TPA: CAP domain-containing protein [Bacteroidia bacterium]|nr:CAP domain-containing protein [Bacteroidia bacterium]
MLRKLSIIAGFSLLAACLFLLPSFTINPEKGVFIDRQQEQKAFVLLNKVRQDPNAYSERYGVSLRGISPRPNLVWNDSLAAVAERKALSMAYNGYFGHVDPKGYGINYYVNRAYPISDDLMKDKKQSTLEAIQGGAPSGEGAIKYIVTNYNNEDPTGRQLVLGEGDFNSSLNEVGIGYVHATTSTKYQTYTVIIIAKRK